MTKRISPRILLLILILISIHQVANAQQQEPVIEYGSLVDLKGVESIFIYTGADIELRNKITKEITKKLKNITITNRPSEGQVCLIYGAAISTFYAGTTTTGTATGTTNSTSTGNSTNTTGTATAQTQSRPQYRTATYGEGTIVVIKPNNTLRIIMSFNDSKGDGPPLATLFERNPSTNFARAFVKAYQEANKEEKKK
jgi:hypothetical protein